MDFSVKMRQIELLFDHFLERFLASAREKMLVLKCAILSHSLTFYEKKFEKIK